MLCKSIRAGFHVRQAPVHNYKFMTCTVVQWLALWTLDEEGSIPSRTVLGAPELNLLFWYSCYREYRSTGNVYSCQNCMNLDCIVNMRADDTPYKTQV